jgi:hypothetical protein
MEAEMETAKSRNARLTGTIESPTVQMANGVLKAFAAERKILADGMRESRDQAFEHAAIICESFPQLSGKELADKIRSFKGKV